MIGQSYKASGKYTSSSVAIFLVSGLLIGFLLSAVYIYLLGLISNMFLRSLVVVGYIFSISWSLIFLVRKTEIRNTRVVLLLTIFVLLIAYYSSWVLMAEGCEGGLDLSFSVSTFIKTVVGAFYQSGRIVFCYCGYLAIWFFEHQWRDFERNPAFDCMDRRVFAFVFCSIILCGISGRETL